MLDQGQQRVIEREVGGGLGRERTGEQEQQAEEDSRHEAECNRAQGYVSAAMNALRIEVTRGTLVESVHRVSAAVVDREGRLLAASGNPDLVTLWRSAAKPFQTLPLLEDGAAHRFGLTDADLALISASHSSEAMHLEGVDRILARGGLTEDQLACGPHPPLSPLVAREVTRQSIPMTPRWSNCSGKHAGLLLLARHHGWPVKGYQLAGHPVQERILDQVTRFTGLARHEIVLAVDGCTTVCFGLPIRAMAVAYARFAASEEPACRRLWGAIASHPLLLAGTGRFDTELIAAWPGQVLAKVGAEGIYSAALPALGVGLTVKVEDGGGRAAPMAVLAALRQVLARRNGPAEGIRALSSLAEYIETPVLDTRGQPAGAIRVGGELHFFGP